MAVDGYIAGTGTTAITRICLFAFVLYRVGAAGVYHRYKVDISIYLLERGANVADTVRILHGLDTRCVRRVLAMVICSYSYSYLYIGRCNG